MSADDTALLVVDVQEKLIRLIPEHARLVWNIRRLIDGAKILGVPVAATEQYPQGLGGTVAELAGRLGQIPAKLTFSCGGCPDLVSGLEQQGVRKLCVAGIEAHVCIQQTVLDLLSHGLRVYVVADAVGSRFDIDYKIALRRMDSAGATLTTAEAALFEWCQQSGTPQFKQISQLVREAAPA
jgi:nicotinamidase-related amidase